MSSEKHWQGFEVRLAAFMEAAWEAGGLAWTEERAAQLSGAVLGSERGPGPNT